jgi:DNA replication and repair protein RecF
VSPSGQAGATEGDGAGITALRLRNFRNFDDLELELPPAGVALVGPNGSGKTNLLEAIYYLETFRSFRGANDAELVRFGQDVFRIEATLETPGETRSLAAGYQKTGRRKKVEVDRREVDRFSDAVGTLGAVVFSLEDVEIVRGPPSERRHFLDVHLSLIEPAYMEALREYRSVLSQRNEALRDGVDEAMLAAWTEGLVEAGARVMAARAGWIAERAPRFRRYHAEISGAAGARMAYDPSAGWPEGVRRGPGSVRRQEPAEDGDRSSGADADEDGPIDGGADGAPASGEGGGPTGGELSDPADPGPWRRRFRRALEGNAERERRREVTVVGPHRDEVEFTGEVADDEERDLRTYGSGGQQRTASLALRLVEADSRRDRLGRDPVYLLDDVFAELDEERAGRLIRLLDEGRDGQVVVTSPKPSDLGLRGGRLEEWRIRDGEVET